MKSHIEEIKSDFEGTIIDLETIGNFNSNFSDSRRYSGIKPVIFGFIDKHKLEIHCAKNLASIEKLDKKMDSIIDTLERPFHAFNSNFERGVLFHSLGREINFERELNGTMFESKASVVSQLGISQYDDPFQDNGRACMVSWENGKIEKSIAHNRSCLLKERDILLKRGHRNPEHMQFAKVD